MLYRKYNNKGNRNIQSDLLRHILFYPFGWFFCTTARIITLDSEPVNTKEFAFVHGIIMGLIIGIFVFGQYIIIVKDLF